MVMGNYSQNIDVGVTVPLRNFMLYKMKGSIVLEKPTWSSVLKK